MPINLLIICHMHPSRKLPRHGIFLTRQAELLSRFGIHCTFVVPRAWAPWPVYRIGNPANYLSLDNPLLDERAATAPYFRLPGWWFKRFDRFFMERAILRATIRPHRIQKFDAILAAPVIPDAAAAVRLKKTLSVPLMTLAIGSDVMVMPSYPRLKEEIQRTLSECALCVGVSEAICQRMQQLVPSCTTLKVFLGRDTGMFRPAKDRGEVRRSLGIPKEALVATYVGLVSATKGSEELLQAATALLANPRFHLLCVGTGPSLRLFQSLNHDRIHLVGEQEPTSVPRYLQAADFFVFPSHSEGMPQSVLEAMHCGLPIVATDVGGVGEAVDHGENGLLVPPKRADLLEQAMSQMLGDDAFRRAAGVKSMEIVSQRFDSLEHARVFAAAIEQVVREGSRR